MKKDEEIKESLEFCKDIYLFYENGEEKSLYPKYKGKEYSDSSEKTVMESGEQKRNQEEDEEEEETEESEDNEEEEIEEEEKKNFYKTQILPVLICIILAFVSAKLLSSYVVQITIVHGDSMESTVSNDDKLLVGKLNYRISNPKRFDVIVFSKEKDQNLIKRIIGLPGEKVVIKDGVIYIDEEVLDEDYGLDPINKESEPVEMKLGKDEYFVLGDNRSVSLDSRYGAIGAVKKDEIIGEVLMRIYPFNKMNLL